MQKSQQAKRFARLTLKHLKLITIDEILVERNHRYLTVILDLQSFAVVHVVDGKGAEALLPFWIK